MGGHLDHLLQFFPLDPVPVARPVQDADGGAGAAHLPAQAPAVGQIPARGHRCTCVANHALQVASVPVNPLVYGFDARDYYVLCSCGWCSLPSIERPARVVCDACDAREEGHRAFLSFAREAALHGCGVEG